MIPLKIGQNAARTPGIAALWAGNDPNIRKYAETRRGFLM